MRAPELVSDGPSVIVPLERLDRAALAALAYALSLSPDVTAVHVGDGVESERFQTRWRERRDGILLDVIAPVGSRTDRIAAYLDARRASDGRPTIVVIPTVAPRQRWLYPLMNWTALRLARGLRRRRATTVVAAPYPV